MKATNSLVLYFLVAMPVFSQTMLPPNSDSEAVVAARSQYTPADAGHDPTDRTPANVNQAPPPRPFHPPARPPCRMAYPGRYPSMYMGEGSGRRQIVGALIGFGLGAAIGVKGNADQHSGASVKAAFLVGGIGALIGAAVSSATPAFQPGNRHRRRSWPDQDEDASIRHGRKAVPLASASTPTCPEKTPCSVVPGPREGTRPVRTASEY